MQRTQTGFAGHVVWVTRPRSEAADLADLIHAMGGCCLTAPLIEIRSRVAPDTLAALANLQAFDGVVVTSANAVRAIATAHAKAAMTPPADSPPWYAVGAATRRAVESLGYRAVVPPGVRSGGQLAEGLAAAAGQGQRLLYLRGQLADSTTAAVLRAAGYTVDEHICYDTVPAPWPEAAWTSFVQAPPPRVLLLFSPSAVQALAAQVDVTSSMLQQETVVGCIGHTTARACRDIGLSVHVVPEKPDAAALVLAAAVEVGRWRHEP